MLIFLFVVLCGFSAVLYLLGPSYLKRKIRLYVYAFARIEANYDQIKIESFDPIKINITNITGKKSKDFYFSFNTLSAELNLKDILLNWGNKFVKFHLTMDGVNVFYKDVPIAGMEKETKLPNDMNATVAANMREYLKNQYQINELDLLVKIGKFDYNVHVSAGKYRLYGNNTTLKISNLETPIDFTFNSYLYSAENLGPLSKTYVPINIHSQVMIKDAVANILKSDIHIAGIKNTFSGLVGLKNMDFDTILKTQISKIETLDFLKIYKDKFPIVDARGAASLEMVIRGNLNNLPASQIKGIFDLKSFEATAKYKTQHINFTGPVTLESKTSFTFTNMVPAINSMSWKLKLDNCAISYKDIFHKDSSVLLVSEGAVSYITDLSIDRFKLLFHTLDVSLKGSASKNKASDISVAVKPFKLQDFKQFLPNNKNYDISGDVEVDAQIKGFFNQPKYLSVNVRKIQANNIKYFLKYKNDMIAMEGPISLNFLGNLSVENSQVLKGSITGHSDLSSLVIVQNNVIRKAATDLFKINWLVQAKEGRLNIEKLDVNTFLTTFNLKGRPPLSQEDSFDLTLNLESLNWKKAKTYLPANAMFDAIADMNNKGSVHVRGRLDPFEIQHSKWSMDTNIHTTVSTLSLPFNFHLTTPPQDANTVTTPALAIQSAFIKDKNLLKTVRWNHKVNVERVIFKDSPAEFQKISLSANLANNHLTMQGEIGQFFNGKMTFSDVIVPLVDQDPKIRFKMSSANLSFSPLVEFVMPEYKNLISGVSNFEIVGHTKMPGTLNFKKDLVAKGHFLIPVSQVHTMNLINEVKQQFAAVKDFGVPSAVKIGDLSASTHSEFEIKNMNLQLTKFNATSGTKDEINLDGNIQFDLNSKIAAVIKLVNVPVRGDFLLANKSPSGHLEIPVFIEGNLMKPKWSFAGNTLEKMTQNFIEYQKNQAQAAVNRKVAAVKQQVQDEVDKKKKDADAEIEKRKKELENEAIKKLNGLFK